MGTILFLLTAWVVQAQETERQYLSGTGLGNTVTWQFRVSEGHNSGRWSKIEVPSQWELQGFGEYTYGRWYKKAGVKNPSMEEGTYKRSFRVPRNWQGQNVRLWFGGVMTDTEVFVNGQSAGPVHQGGFYRFSYDVTDLLKFGSNNQIEVRVKKHSDNKSINAAERKADWWLFGGIYRPVWLEAKPATHIERLAVDARADGELKVEVHLQGTTGEESLSMEVAPISAKDAEHRPVKVTKDSVQLLTAHFDGISPWTPESPVLYRLTISLLGKEGNVIHSMDTRIGFRTIDFRPRDGLYLNGTKLVMKGINRHTFHPDGGRTTNKELSIQDVKLIKEMNMNAVRSHYPPDEHFLDACDSLGLLYIDELAGWQDAYDTPTGTRLVREMLTRDVNHPCIVLWSNGNEGGWNTAIDSLFRTYDPQNVMSSTPGRISTNSIRTTILLISPVWLVLPMAIKSSCPPNSCMASTIRDMVPDWRISGHVTLLTLSLPEASCGHTATKLYAVPTVAERWIVKITMPRMVSSVPIAKRRAVTILSVKSGRLYMWSL